MHGMLTTFHPLILSVLFNYLAWHKAVTVSPVNFILSSTLCFLTMNATNLMIAKRYIDRWSEDPKYAYLFAVAIIR